MSSAELPAGLSHAPGSASGRKRPLPLRIGAGIENAIVVFALAMMVLLPLLEIVLRKMQTGITGSSDFVKHGTLIVGLIGGAVAARQNRLLSLATSALLPAGWPRRSARLIAGSVAAAVAALLCYAAWQFVRDERPAGRILAYGIPVWTLQLILPIGFGLITVKILWQAADGWIGRVAAFVACAGLLGCFGMFDQPGTWVIVSALILLLLATVLGTPIFALLGGAAIILFWQEQSPIASIPLDHYSLVTNATLPTIPLFTLAGYFLAEGGASRRLVRVFAALFVRIRGGPAIVTVLVCAFFTSFTGASGVTILALGGLLLPILLSSRYSDRSALGLVTSAGALGMLFPPCLPLILYAIIAEQPIEQIFLAGILPGVLLVVVTMAFGIWLSPPAAHGLAEPFRLAEAARAVWHAKWELLLPVVALVSLFSGLATPVGAAAITALYAFITQVIVWRDLRIIKDVPRVMTECAVVVGGVLLILGVAKGFTNYLVLEQIPDRGVEWVRESVSSPYTFLLLLNLFLLIVGCLMDVYSATIVVVPLLIPIARQFNIDPLHLGIIFLANLELGYLTPPVGMNLFLSSYRFGKPVSEVARAVVPMIMIRLVAVLIITYVPPITTMLPRLFSQPPPLDSAGVPPASALAGDRLNSAFCDVRHALRTQSS